MSKECTLPLLWNVIQLNSPSRSMLWSIHKFDLWTCVCAAGAAGGDCRSQRGRGGAAHISGEVPSGGAESLRGARHGSVQVFGQRRAHRHVVLERLRRPVTQVQRRDSANGQKNFNLSVIDNFQLFLSLTSTFQYYKNARSKRKSAQNFAYSISEKLWEAERESRRLNPSLSLTHQGVPIPSVGGGKSGLNESSSSSASFSDGGHSNEGAA